ncbi:MAG: PQQ-dependent sugar dehydrogenase [Flavobacteriales bacterium]|nr:PQQ-dependent sugar dehydrogenase [Flavobacteriales bacterium]
MKTRSKILLISAFAIACAQPGSAQLPSSHLATRQWATNLIGVTDITNCGDSRLFVTKQEGRIRIITDSMQVLPTSFLTIMDSVNDASNEQGLLGLAFDPDYANNGYFYVHYIGGTGTGYSKISRFQVSQNNPDSAMRNSEETIYIWPQPYSNHNGGDLAFGPDGYLYATFGDGGSANDPQGNAQDLSDPLGDIIRIDVSDPDTTFTIPPDNPFAASANGIDTLPEIWASGLRNPYRFGFDAVTGDMWIGDVGQNAYEEVDFWPAGDNSGPNFGWRCYEANAPNLLGGCGPIGDYDAPVSIHPQADQGWCSVMGGRVYRGSQYPNLSGRYIYTDYCGGQFYSLLPDGNGGWDKEQLLATGLAGWSSIAEDSALNIFATNINNDRVYKLYDPCPMAPPTISVNANLLESSVGTAYWWYLNGNIINGANSQSYEPQQSGVYSVVVTVSGSCSLESDTVSFVYTGIGVLDTAPLSLMPNPASDLVVISLGRNSGDARSLLVFDAVGRMVSTRLIGGGTSATLELADFPNGSYIVSVRDGNGQEIGKAALTVVH